jgi:hypothetical protein
VPRKPTELPQPCPLCGRKYGTYQYVIFQPKAYQRYYPGSERVDRRIKRRSHVICRIGHYDPNYYLAMKRGQTKRGIKQPYGKFWHSFTVNWEPVALTREGMTVDLEHYFAEFLDDEWHRTSLTVKPERWMSDKIKEFGWHMVPDRHGLLGGLQIRRRPVKEYPIPLS